MTSTECKINPLFIDFIDKHLSKEDTDKVKKHLDHCPSCRTEVEQLLNLVNDLNDIRDKKPGAGLREGFMQTLEEAKSEIARQDKRSVAEPGKTRFLTGWLHSPVSQIAAGFALLVSGILLGLMFNSGKPNDELVYTLQNEVEQVKQTMILAKLEQQSASQRLQAVNYTEEIRSPDYSIINALIQTMNTDDNVNVRMAAIHALSKYSENKAVRDALVASLEIQADPLIQITLINLMVEMRETKALDRIRDILEDENTHDAVKQLAEKGIATFI